MIKKSILTLPLAAVMAVTAMTPTQANATLLAPALLDSVISAIFGVALVSGSIGYVNEKADIDEGTSADRINDALGKWIPKQDTLAGTIFVNTIIGTLILDNSGHAKAALSPIGEDVAKKAQITPAELLSYNAELEITQQVLDQVSAEISQKPKAEQNHFASKLWDQYRSVMSPESFSALQKLIALQLQ